MRLGRAGPARSDESDEGDNDIILDFEDGLDELALEDFGFESTAEALSFATKVADDALFGFDGGATILIENFTVARLQNDLILV